MRKSIAFVSVLVGLFASSYLTWAYTSSTHRMVCMGGGCDEVRASKFAHLWGIALPIYGLAFYVFLAVLMIAESRVSEHSAKIWRLVLIFTAGGVLFSAWLTGLEAFVIHAWCEWCVTQAIAVCVAFLLTITIVLRPPATKEAGGSSGEPSGTGRQFRTRLAVLVVAIVVGAPALALIIRSEKKLQEPTKVVVPKGSATLIRADSHVTGPADAPLTIVEFGDFQCPSCGMAEKTNRAIRDQYGNKIRYVFRQFPLAQIHQFALEAAKASECAGGQGKFWPMVEELYGNQSDLSAPALKKYAADEGLDGAKFDACMEDDPAVTARIQQDIADGQALGIRATPTFFVNGKKIEGGLTFLDIAKAFSEINSGKPEAAQTSEPSALQPGGGIKETAAPKKANPRGDKAEPPKHAAVASAKPVGFGLSGGTNPFATPNSSSAFVPCGLEETKVQDPPMIHIAEMKKLVEDKSATFVDVRGSGAFKEAHIPTAVNVTLDQLEKRIPPELSKSKEIIFYEAGGADDSCTTSKTAGRILMQNGFKEVKVFKEGLEGWKKQGLPTAQ